MKYDFITVEVSDENLILVLTKQLSKGSHP